MKEMTLQVRLRFDENVKNHREVVENVANALVNTVKTHGYLAPSEEETYTERITVSFLDFSVTKKIRDRQ